MQTQSQETSRSRRAGLIGGCAVAAVLLTVALSAVGQKDAGQQTAQQQREAAQLEKLLGDGAGIGLGRDVGPPPEALEPLKEKLDKKIRVQFLDTPLERVIEFLQRESGITMLINRAAVGGLSSEPVSLEAESMSIKDALDWASVATGTDWDVIKGVVVISTARAIQLRRLETRVYDIRALLVQVPNFSGGVEMDVDSSLSNTSSGGSAVTVARASTTLFGEDEHSADVATRDESIEQVTTLIQDTVGRQEEWAAYGGEVSSLRELNGNLIVKTTPRNHAAIIRLLRQLADAAARMVHIEGRYYQVSGDLLDEIIAGNGGAHIFDAAATDALIKKLTAADASVKRFGVARMSAFNGQRTYLTALSNSAFLSDVEPVANTAGIDPTLSVSHNGARLDVETTIGFDSRSLTLTFRGDVVTGADMGASNVPTGSPAKAGAIEGGGELSGAARPHAITHKSGAKEVTHEILTGNVKIDADVKAAQPAVSGNATLEMPRQDLVSYRSSVTIPDGGAVLLTGASSMLKSVEGDKGEVVLILRARGHTLKENPANDVNE